MRIQQSAAIAAIALGLSAAVSTQEPVDLAALDRIKSEAFARSAKFRAAPGKTRS